MSHNWCHDFNRLFPPPLLKWLVSDQVPRKIMICVFRLVMQGIFPCVAFGFWERVFEIDDTTWLVEIIPMPWQSVLLSSVFFLIWSHVRYLIQVHKLSPWKCNHYMLPFKGILMYLFLSFWHLFGTSFYLLNTDWVLLFARLCLRPHRHENHVSPSMS
jgi:hypothetical protein